MPLNVHPAAVSAVYALAGPHSTRQLVIRFPEETRNLLRSSAPLPPALIEQVLAGDDHELRTVLASSTAQRLPEVFERLAAMGDPRLAPALYFGTRTCQPSTEQRIRIWQGAAATADDPAWRQPDGIVARLLRWKPEKSGLHSPFPELIRNVLRDEAPRAGETSEPLTPPEQLLGCRNALRYGGTQALREVAGLATLHPRVADRVRLAVESTEPADILDQPLPEGEETVPDTASPPVEELIAELRSDDNGQLPEQPGGLDWDALLAAHRERRFPERALRWLWRQPHCPEELAVAAAAELSWDPVGELYWSTLTTVDWGEAHRSLRTILPAGISSGAFPVDRVLSEIGPAYKVLEGLPVDHDQVREALGALVARLGTEFSAWRALYTLLRHFEGPLTELVDAALAEEPKHQGKTWLRPAGMEFPYRPGTGDVIRRVWLRCFLASAPETQHALSAHLDRRSIQYLLVNHTPGTDLRAHLVRAHGTAVLAGLACHRQHTPSEVIEELITYDEPEINAALYLHTDLTDAQRHHIILGRRREQGEAAPTDERLPLAPALIQGLKSSSSRGWLLPILESGDPGLCRILLRGCAIRTDARNLHLLVRLWERHGPEEVRALLDETGFPRRHPLPAPILNKARKALERSDGLAALRQARQKAAGPEGLVKFLRARGSRIGTSLRWAMEAWEEENGPATVPWPELCAAHRNRPLHDQLLVNLAELPACPAELAEAADDAALRLSHGNYRPRRGSHPPSPTEMVREFPLPVSHDISTSPTGLAGGATSPHSSWLIRAHEAGKVTLSEGLQHAFPAQNSAAALASVLTPPRDDTDSGSVNSRNTDLREAEQALNELVRHHLDADDPEDWALVLHLMPDFEGTLPELLASAGAVLN